MDTRVDAQEHGGIGTGTGRGTNLQSKESTDKDTGHKEEHNLNGTFVE